MSYITCYCDTPIVAAQARPQEHTLFILVLLLGVTGLESRGMIACGSVPQMFSPEARRAVVFRDKINKVDSWYFPPLPHLPHSCLFHAAPLSQPCTLITMMPFQVQKQRVALAVTKVCAYQCRARYSTPAEKRGICN